MNCFSIYFTFCCGFLIFCFSLFKRSRVSMDRQSQERSMDENGTSSRRESSTFVSSTERRTSSYNQSSTSTVNEPSAVAAPIETLTLTTTTTSKSFLQDRTPVRGMQDIIGRMRAGDAGKKTSSFHFLLFEDLLKIET
jgi:hypothetical protein